jgi:hypothetical protein
MPLRCTGMFTLKVNSPSAGHNVGYSHRQHGKIYKSKGKAGRKTKNGKYGFDAQKKIHVPKYVWRTMRVCVLLASRVDLC